MQKIPLDSLKTGMVIGDDVINPQGILLAYANSTVDEAMVRRFFMAGVDEVIVMGKHVPGFDIGYDAQAVYDRLPQLFEKYREDPFMLSMYAILLKHFKVRI
ncbi:MAG: hypothetical protein RRY29_01350 [Desulfovibrionaceae bacterium]